MCVWVKHDINPALDWFGDDIISLKKKGEVLPFQCFQITSGTLKSG